MKRSERSGDGINEHRVPSKCVMHSVASAAPVAIVQTGPPKSDQIRPDGDGDAARILAALQDALKTFGEMVDNQHRFTTSESTYDDKKRTALMKWVLQIADYYVMDDTTTGYLVHLIDSVLITSSPSQEYYAKLDLGLVGLACVLLTSKFQGGVVIPVKDLWNCAPKYTMRQIIDMEKQVLSMLDWRLNMITSSDICDHVLRTGDASKRLIEISHALLHVGGSEGSSRWWLEQERSTLALAAIRTSTEICGATFPHLSHFMQLVDEREVEKSRRVFLEIYAAVSRPIKRQR